MLELGRNIILSSWYLAEGLFWVVHSYQLLSLFDDVEVMRMVPLNHGELRRHLHTFIIIVPEVVPT